MIFNNFQKGEFKSEYIQDGFAYLVNCDINKMGTIQSQLALTFDSDTPNEDSILVAVPSGKIYALSRESGKIWERATNGTWTLGNTNANGAHVGGGFFNNRLWYATSTKLGYFDLSSTWSDSFGTFGNTSTTRPFCRGGVNRAFAYFGDGAQIARVDKDNTFSANVLEIPLGETITDIKEWGDDLVLTSTGIDQKIYRWNQYGDTYYKPDLISYKDVDMLIQSQNSNIIYALCRTKDDYAEFMYYTGSELAELEERRITTTTDADSYMSVEFDGRANFAVGTKIYTIRNQALVCEYTCAGEVQGMTTDGDNLFVSCNDQVYKIGTSRANAVIQTPVVEGKATQFAINYDIIPTGTSITARVKINGGSWTSVTMVNETENSRYVMRESFPAKNINFLQGEVTLVSATTTTPVIRSIEFL